MDPSVWQVVSLVENWRWAVTHNWQKWQQELSDVDHDVYTTICVTAGLQVARTCYPHDCFLWISARTHLGSRFTRKLIQTSSRVSWPLGNGPSGFHTNFHIPMVHNADIIGILWLLSGLLQEFTKKLKLEGNTSMSIDESSLHHTPPYPKFQIVWDLCHQSNNQSKAPKEMFLELTSDMWPTSVLCDPEWESETS